MRVTSAILASFLLAAALAPGASAAPTILEDLRDEVCDQMMGQDDCGGAPRAADPFVVCVTEPCGPSAPGVPGVPLVGDSCSTAHADGTVTFYLYSNCGVRVTALGSEYCYDGAGCQDPCSLPDVGRTGAGLFWNDDCSADPHLDTSGSCLGGGGKDVRVFQRGNVNVVVTVCDGPGPDPTVTASAPDCNGPFYTERTVGPVTVFVGGGLSSGCNGVRVDRLDAPQSGESPLEDLRDRICRQMMGQDDCTGTPP